MFATKSSISKTNKLHFCGYSSFSTNFNFIMENKDAKVYLIKHLHRGLI